MFFVHFYIIEIPVHTVLSERERERERERDRDGETERQRDREQIKKCIYTYVRIYVSLHYIYYVNISYIFIYQRKYLRTYIDDSILLHIFNLVRFFLFFSFFLNILFFVMSTNVVITFYSNIMPRMVNIYYTKKYVFAVIHFLFLKNSLKHIFLSTTQWCKLESKIILKNTVLVPTRVYIISWLRNISSFTEQ